MALINKLTGFPVSEEMRAVLERLNKGQDVSLQEIQELQEVKEAYSCIAHGVPTIQLLNRENIRKNVYEKLQKIGSAVIDGNGDIKYNGIVKKESRIDIVIGLPASGKSSTLVNPISQQHKSRIIDSDEAKKLLPEYNNGWGANIVHEESKFIANNQLFAALLAKENIVYPIVGSNAEKLVNLLKFAKTKSKYNVYLHYNEIRLNEALARLLSRFLENGRFIPPEILFKYGDKVKDTYQSLKGGDFIDGYSKWNNDLPRGKRPECIEYRGDCLQGMAGSRGEGRAINIGWTEESIQKPGRIQKAHVGEPLLNGEDKKENPKGFSFFAEKDDYSAFIKEHKEKLHEKLVQSNHASVVINAFGGPGAGKSTASLGIAEELKKLGYVAEYVPEYSKELVWDENWLLLDGTAAHQFIILEEQMKRMDRLVGKVDFIVTDAPILLNQVYNKELTPGYEKMLQELYHQYENFNFLVKRDPKEFEKEGRIHDLKESLQKDEEIQGMLNRYGLYYGVYNHASVSKVVANAVKTHQRISLTEEPVYLNIPHISDRKEFRELITKLKSQGAKYDSRKNKWYITGKEDHQSFSPFLPGEEKQSILQKLNENKSKIETETGRKETGKKHENTALR